MKALTNLLSLVALISLGTTTYAGKAHVHGHGQLAIALNDKVIEMEFVAPAADLFGFESTSKARKNKAKVDSIVEQLKLASDLFIWQESSKCSMKQYDIKVFGEHHTKLKQKSKPKHGHHHHQKHSELIAKYQFSCSERVKEDGFKVSIIKAFPNIKEMDIIVFSDEKQSAFKGLKSLIPIIF